jgi:hypothetical protein
MEGELLNMLSRMGLAHDAIERMMDEEAANNPNARQVLSPAQKRANMAAEVVSAAQSRHDSAKLFLENSIEQFKKNGRSLTTTDRQAVANIELFLESSDSATSNSEIFGATPSELGPNETKTMQRTPSYLLLMNVLEDVHYRYQGNESLEKGNLSMKKRQLLTTQTAAIKLQAETLTDESLCHAVTGQRYSPMTLDAEKFQLFVVNSRQSILKVRDALTLAPLERDTALKSAFLQVATNYFCDVNKRPSGIPRQVFSEELCGQVGDQKIGYEPITIVLTDTDKFPVGHIFVVEAPNIMLTRLALEIGTKNLLTNNRLGLPTETALGQTDTFKSASAVNKQAAALLHNLFFALADAEENMNFHECRRKFGENIPLSALRPIIEKSYKGSTEIGDAINADQSVSQRFAYSERFELGLKSVVKQTEATGIRALLGRRSSTNTEENQMQGSPLLLDESLIKWAGSSDARHALHSLRNPTDRLRIAQIPTVDAALLKILPV